MKIAVTYENGQIFQHFGHTEQFKIYEVANGKVISSEVVSTMGSGHGALAGFLKEKGIRTLVCGGIGGGAKMALQEAGITLYGGVSGEADKAIEQLLQNNLKYNAEVECSHHHNEEHGCGEHKCSN
jgi:predicted Fe-Mo cluster-binding NifX family protein